MPSRWEGDDREPPNRLVYLLDHEYTQRGLDWDRLKGADAERAALLQAAAEDAGCEAVLALTEINETWDTEPRRRGRGTCARSAARLGRLQWSNVPAIAGLMVQRAGRKRAGPACERRPRRR